MGTEQLPPLDELFVDSSVPTDSPCEYLDARELPPPQPLQNTLERLEALDGTVLVQLNDRAPQHLYPLLADRNYQYETVSAGEIVVTAIWEE